MAATFAVSLELLRGADRQRCVELAVFPAGESIPLAAIQTLFEIDEFEADELALRLSNSSILEYDISVSRIRLHDMTRVFLASSLDERETVHGRLVAALGDPLRLTGDYAWRWYPYHLCHAGKSQDLVKLLLDPDWLRSKLDATDIDEVISDCDLVPDAPAIQKLKRALRLSAHVLAADTKQLRTQLLLRLRGGKDATIDHFRRIVNDTSWEPWLRPLESTLPDADGPLACLMVPCVPEYTTGRVRPRLCTSARGDFVLGVIDGTVWLWDVGQRTGRPLDLEAVDAAFICRAPDHAIIAMRDGRLQLWEFASMRSTRPIGTHPGNLRRIVADPHENVIVSLSDTEVRAWNVADGELLSACSIELNSDVCSVAVSWRERRVAVASESEIHVLDLGGGSAHLRIDCDELGISALALSPDARLLLTQADTFIRIWDLLTMMPVPGARFEVRAGVAATFSQDGRYLIASDASEIMVSEIVSGARVATLSAGHVDRAEAICIDSSDRLICSLESGRLLVWDYDVSRAGLPMRNRQSGAISTIALSPDRGWMVTASQDTVRRWRVAERGASWDREIFGSAYLASAVSPSGDWFIGMQATDAAYVVPLTEQRTQQLPSCFRQADGIANPVLVSSDERWILATPRAMELPEGDPQRLHEWMHKDHFATRLWDSVSNELFSFEDAVTADAFAVRRDTREFVAWCDGNLYTLPLDGPGFNARPMTIPTEYSSVRLSANAQRALVWKPGGAAAVVDIEKGQVHPLCEDGAAANWSISAGGAVAVAWEVDVAVWDLNDCTVRARFIGDSAIGACRILREENTVVVGDHAGHVSILELRA